MASSYIATPKSVKDINPIEVEKEEKGNTADIKKAEMKKTSENILKVSGQVFFVDNCCT